MKFFKLKPELRESKRLFELAESVFGLPIKKRFYNDHMMRAGRVAAWNLHDPHQTLRLEITHLDGLDTIDIQFDFGLGDFRLYDAPPIKVEIGSLTVFMA